MPAQDKDNKLETKEDETKMVSEANDNGSDQDQNSNPEEKKTVEPKSDTTQAIGNNEPVKENKQSEQATAIAGKTQTESQSASVIITGSEIEPEVVTEERGNLKWVAIIVVLVLLIIALGGGAFYYLTQYKLAPELVIISPEAEVMAPVESPITPEEDRQIMELKKMGTNDEIETLVSDLEDTKLDDLDKEVTEIDSELAE